MSERSFLRPDLHLHSDCSDGTDSPEELLRKVRAAKLDFFSLTDHDTTQGCEEIVRHMRSGDPAFLRGVEFSCEDAKGKYHVLGYGYDTKLPAMGQLVKRGHNLRMEKAENRFRFLHDRYGFCFTNEEKREVLSVGNPGKPHFVALLLRKGFITAKSEGFALLENCPGGEATIPPEAAIEAILRSNGIPVLAHGILADGSCSLSKEQITQRVQRLKKAGLKGLECFYSTYTLQQQEIMLDLASDFDLLITAGSDYHGANKSVEIGEMQLTDVSVLRPFFEITSDRIIVKE